MLGGAQAQDVEIAYAPSDFKLSTTDNTTIEPVLMTRFPVTAEGTDSQYLVVVLIVRGPKAWTGSLTTENTVAILRDGSRIRPGYLAFGAVGSFTFGPGSGPPSKLVFKKTGVVVGAGSEAVALSPMLAFKGTAAPVKYESNAFPAQFWFLFPLRGLELVSSVFSLAASCSTPRHPSLPDGARAESAG